MAVTVDIEADAGYRDSLKIWAKLSDGPWLGKEPMQADDALGREIYAIRYEGKAGPIYDMGAALVFRGLLETNGFISREHAENGWIRWFKAEIAPEPDTRTWVEREQAALDAAAARERSFMDQQFEHQRALERQQAEFLGPDADVVRALRAMDVVPRSELQPRIDAAVAPLHQELTAVHQELAALREQLPTNEKPRRIGRRGK